MGGSVSIHIKTDGWVLGHFQRKYNFLIGLTVSDEEANWLQSEDVEVGGRFSGGYTEIGWVSQDGSVVVPGMNSRRTFLYLSDHFFPNPLLT